MRKVLNLVELVVQSGARLAALACLAMVACVTADVFMRNVFNNPLDGTLEIVAYVLMPAVALGFGYAQLRDEQIRVTMLVELASSKMARLLSALTELVILALAVWIFTILLDGARESYAIDERVASQEWIRVWASNFVLVAAYALLALGAFHRIASLLLGLEEPYSSDFELEGVV